MVRQVVARGSSTEIAIDGAGVARLGGEQPRMYVYEENKTWNNVEITFYAKRTSERSTNYRQGFIAGARSEHQAVTDETPCLGYAYYGRMLYNGRVNVIKELSHPPAPVEQAYSSNKPSANYRVEWGTPNGEIPFDRWIGHKFIVRNCDYNTKVRLSLYRDMTEGENGGDWEQLLHEADNEDWPVSDLDPNCDCLPTQVLTWPASSVFIRNTEIDAADYTKFSIREIDPE